MKKTLLILFILTGLFSKAQQAELLSDTWYLTQISIDGEDYFTPASDVSSMPPFEEEISLDYGTEITEGVILTNGCNEFSVEFTDLDDDSFVVSGVSTTLMDCEFPLYSTYDSKYFQFYGGMVVELPWFGSQYEIITNPDSTKTLKVTNPNGDIAIYGNEKLASQEVSNLAHVQVVFHQNELIIKGMDVSKVLIYDVSGKLVLNSVVKNNQIQTNQLPNGIYVVKIWNQKGEIYSVKSVKR